MTTLPGTDIKAKMRRTDRGWRGGRNVPTWRVSMDDLPVPPGPYIETLKARGFAHNWRAGASYADFTISTKGEPITVTDGRRTRTYANQAAYDYLEPQVQRCLPKPKRAKVAA